MNNKTIKIGFESLEQVNDALAKIAALQTHIEAREAKMNELILKVKNRYEPEINGCIKQIEAIESDLIRFAKSNKKIFKEQRSIKLTYGKIGFRLGNISLKLIDKKNWTWDRVKEKFQDLFATKYVSVKTQIQKNKIIEDIKAEKLRDETLATCGIAADRSESFYYEINWDEIRLEKIQ